VDAGVDVVVAQGWEAGGHVWGEVATLPLVPRVVDAVYPTPVVAAGGIADGRGVAAVLALGAAGAWIGTRFLMSEEALAPPTYRELLMRACEADTVYSRIFDQGWPNAPHRALRNSTIKRWEEAGCPPSGRRPGEGETIAAFPGGEPVQRYADVHPVSGMIGELEALALYAGQSVGLVTRTQTAENWWTRPRKYWSKALAWWSTKKMVRKPFRIISVTSGLLVHFPDVDRQILDCTSGAPLQPGS
jgi:nitronate monooxygenase